MADILQNLTELDQDKIQEISLVRNTDENNLIPNTSRSKHKLETDNKTVNKAINEVRSSASESQEKSDAFNSRFNTVIGDENTPNNDGDGDKDTFEELKLELNARNIIQILKILNTGLQNIELPDLSGETIPASVRSEFEFKNLDNSNMSINNYADRAPGANVLSLKTFKNLYIPDLQENDRVFDGTYFVRDN